MAERPSHDPELGEACECFSCHIHGGLTIGLPRDFKSRTYQGRPRVTENAYERGIPSSVRPDGSKMPYLTANGDTMGQKEFDRKSHLIDDNRRKLEATALQPST